MSHAPKSLNIKLSWKSQLWSLFITKQTDTHLLISSLNPGGYSLQWREAVLERDPFFNGGYTDILKLKCWVINLLQFSQMNWIYWFNIPSKGPSMIADISPLKFEVSGITRLLRNVNAKKACGPDNISLAGFWKTLRLSLPYFSSIFLLCQYKTGQLPSDWVTANVTPVFKNRNREDPSSHRTYCIPAHHESPWFKLIFWFYSGTLSTQLQTTALLWNATDHSSR